MLCGGARQTDECVVSTLKVSRVLDIDIHQYGYEVS
jgi:hypothetical protein